ncbi:MAG: hypothetical protein NTV23_14795 [Propionibacteriales bacterium]|nr:hypothetical protein [Propionibacteriales bacterium]
MPSGDLVVVADELYALAPGEFTAARDRAARAAADKALSLRVKALRKPSLAAWLVNLLVRREAEQIDQVLTLAESLRAAAASLDGDELRTLTRQRRQLTSALTTTAGRLAREFDVRMTPAVADQVEGVLTAAMLDPVAAQVVRSGLVVTGFTATGVSVLDVAAVCAVPDALGHRAGPLSSGQPKPPALHVVPDDAIRLEAAQEQVEAAALELAEVTEELQHQRASAERLAARSLQLQGEIDELRRRLAVLEDDVDAVDEESDAVTAAVTRAEVEVAAAEDALVAARAELARLTR